MIDKNVILGLLIPLIGTSAGSACVFFDGAGCGDGIGVGIKFK